MQTSSPQLRDQPAPGAPAAARNPSQSDFQISPPSVALPKGGGAIRGIGEKFSVNSSNGTGTLSVPISLSPGRSGFGPQLALQYDSGAGNGAFGLGWSIALPSITRRTDKGIPQYGHDDIDVFVLSGAEDLVPVFQQQPDGTWTRDQLGQYVVDELVRGNYIVRRYRPRVEGLFARIERWMNRLDPADTFWRSISRDNLCTWYGRTAESRVCDPADPSRIFSWLICSSYDDKGNAIVYRYEAEDSTNVDLGRADELHRSPAVRATQRYLKRVLYGNRTANRDANWDANDPALLNDWMFEVVFDYGEHRTYRPAQPAEFNRDSPSFAKSDSWPARLDPISTYRAGFEVRTYRLCRRVLMFHHFPGELPVNDCLVRSTDFTYDENEIATFLTAVEHVGYRVKPDGTYVSRAMPPLTFHYSRAAIDPRTGAIDPLLVVREIDAESAENLPAGADGARAMFVDLDGEGISGILCESMGGWYYKSSLGEGRFAALKPVAPLPAGVELRGGRHQLLDLAGDGRLDLVQLSRATPGFYERVEDCGWETFRAFVHTANIDWTNPNTRLVDLTGDGLSDILVTEADCLTWFRSLGELGFAAPCRIATAADERDGPRLLLVDGTQTVFLADMSGDGLSDLVRIRPGEIAFWPNLGHGRFGSMVVMQNSPQFDSVEQFDPRRIRFADVDGSGVTDIVYLGQDGVDVYFNQSGNGWSNRVRLPWAIDAHSIGSVQITDFLGSGTACLVWSSANPADSRRPMRYVDLMGGKKPHLLERVENNLGAETRVQYASSTQFYLQDKREGRAWITRLPFPVHVVERMESIDRISRNRFVTRYAYHHGFYDGDEREFRGFGLVEQWDTEAFDTSVPIDGGTTNEDAAYRVPPAHTKTWFHTGAWLDGERISRQMTHEYYGAPSTDAANYEDMLRQFNAGLLPDTILPTDIEFDEAAEACRALRGSVLREEVYSRDGTERAPHPYRVSERNYTVRRVQPRGWNQHAVFFTHARETIDFQYERRPIDPRVTHQAALKVDSFGNVLRSVSIGYARRDELAERPEQAQTHATLTVNSFTNAIATLEAWRTPLPCESRVYELVKPPRAIAAAAWPMLSFESLSELTTALLPTDRDSPSVANSVPFENWNWRASWNPVIEPGGIGVTRLRLLDHQRTLYRRDDLSAALPLYEMESQALPFEAYRLAFTPGLIDSVYRRESGSGVEQLINDPAGQLGVEGGYVLSQTARAGGIFPNTDADHYWWIPSGRLFFSGDAAANAAQERDFARAHFYLPHRYADPFGGNTTIAYDTHNLLMLQTRDALGNCVTAGTHDEQGTVTSRGNDYRVLQARHVTDPNRNQAIAEFDVLGIVTATAVMGKPGENLGDDLSGFTLDLTDAEIAALIVQDDLRSAETALLGKATTRLLYDLFAYMRTRGDAQPQPAAVWTLKREKHDSHLDHAAGEQTAIQHSVQYSDGFGREIQSKSQAEPGPLIAGGPDVASRWVGSGWTIFNNKGKPVRRYEPFFSATHQFEFARVVGVSGIAFYDPLGRVVGAMHPDHAFEKTEFDPWRQVSWDRADTVLMNPLNDPVVGAHSATLPADEVMPTWHGMRTDAALARVRWPDVLPEAVVIRAAERTAAEKTAVFSDTPTILHFDSLGRAVATVTHNRYLTNGVPIEERPETRVTLDIEGGQRAVIDALGRVVMQYELDLPGRTMTQSSMEAGQRWMLMDCAGNPLYLWDSRGHTLRTEYDELRRATRVFCRNVDGANRLVQRTVYGESQAGSFASNLRQKPYQVFDQAGVVTNSSYDFKGNLSHSGRRMVEEYKSTVDWSAPPAVLGGEFTAVTNFDALNRPAAVTTPDGTVIRPRYNEASLLESLSANLRGAAGVTEFIKDIAYNARGQRTRIVYGNLVATNYEYEEDTFALRHMSTARGAAFPEDDPIPVDPGRGVQNLYYTYDAARNVSHIRDTAQQTVYFRNRRVEPSCDYTYDALYRLISDEGREHLGLGGNGDPHPPTPCSENDAPRVRLAHPGDGQALGRYMQRYVYDVVGNIQQMIHHGVDPANPGWTRTYTYAEQSQLENDKVSNRLSSTWLGGAAPVERYGHDVHGNMTSMPHLPLMQWNYLDQLSASSREASGGAAIPEITYYVYDAAGQRVRKVTERSVSAADAAVGRTATRRSERIYVGGFEIYREYAGDGATVSLERETLHVMDDKQRIALVETRTQGDDGSPAQLIRYQYGNHLGSASLELDSNGRIISYEEYYPYGSTSYSATRNNTDAPKRYRYSGKERDEETGLDYYGARFCAHWIARWTSSDPSGIMDGPNTYVFVQCNPIVNIDPNGQWTWKQVAVVAAVITVAVAVTVVTAGAAAPAVAAAAATVGGTAAGATGAAAVTLAGTVAVGAAAGGLSGAAADLTAQALTNESGQSIDWNRTGAAAAGGAAAGGALSVIPGVAAARSVAQAVRTGATAAQVAAAARNATAATGGVARQLARGAATGAVAGATGGAIQETTRQIASGETQERGGFDTDSIASSTVLGAAFGAGGAVIGAGARAASRNIRVRAAASAQARARGGEAAAAIHEPASGQIALGSNEAPTRPLHRILIERMSEFENIPSKTRIEHPNYYGRAGQQHAERNALNEALFLRESALGRPATTDDLADMLLHVQRARGGGNGNPMPRCSCCNYVTEGVQLTAQMRGAEREQLQSVISGKWPMDRPF